MTKRSEIVRLAKSGFPPSAIAAMLACSPDHARVEMMLARKRGEDVPCYSRKPGDPPRTVRVAFDQYEADALDAAAREHNITVSTLITQLVMAAIHDDLIEAILS